MAETGKASPVVILQSDTLTIQAECLEFEVASCAEEKLDEAMAASPVNSKVTDSDFDDDSPFPWTPASHVSDEQTLSRHGYKKVTGSHICNQTLQGEIFECSRSENGLRKRFAVKKLWKKLCASGIAYEDGMSFVVENDIVKEAFIINLLTVKNEPPAHYLTNFVDLFEDDNATYLVTEYGGDQTLTQFVGTAHRHWKNGSLSAGEWKKTVKYVMWQLCVIVRWLHCDMHCCHLDLSMDTIQIQNGSFVLDESADVVTVNPALTVQIADFGSAEIFNNATFQCGKAAMTGNYQYCAPQVYNNMVYDARKADVYQLGCILFHLSFFSPIYRYQESALDASFQCIERNDLLKLINMRNLQHLASNKLITLLGGMVHVKQKHRATLQDVVQHSYFAAYWKTYAPRLQKASRRQKKKNLENAPIMQNFPFYSINYC